MARPLSVWTRFGTGVMPEGDLAAFGQQAVALADQATRVIGGSIPGVGSDNP